MISTSNNSNQSNLGNFRLSSENLLSGEPVPPDAGIPPPLPSQGPGEWRHHMRTVQGLSALNSRNVKNNNNNQEEAIPSDSLYGTRERFSNQHGTNTSFRKENQQPKITEPPIGELSHWSSHGYLAKQTNNNNTEQVKNVE